MSIFKQMTLALVVIGIGACTNISDRPVAAQPDSEMAARQIVLAVRQAQTSNFNAARSKTPSIKSE